MRLPRGSSGREASVPEAEATGQVAGREVAKLARGQILQVCESFNVWLLPRATGPLECLRRFLIECVF